MEQHSEEQFMTPAPTPTRPSLQATPMSIGTVKEISSNVATPITATTGTLKTATTATKRSPTVAIIDDPLALNHVLFDLIDLYAYMYLHEPKHSRLDQLKHYLAQQQGPIEAYGRLYSRIQSVNILSTISEAVDLLPTSIHNYTIIKQMIPKIQEVRHSCMRKDADCCTVSFEDEVKSNVLNYYDDTYYVKWVMESHYKKIFLDDFDLLKDYLGVIECLYQLCRMGDIEKSGWSHMEYYFNTVNNLPDGENKINTFPKKDLLSIFIIETNENGTITYKLQSSAQIQEKLWSSLRIEPVKHILKPIQNVLISWDATALSLPRLVQLGYNQPYQLSSKQKDVELVTEEEVKEYEKIVNRATEGLHIATPGKRSVGRVKGGKRKPGRPSMPKKNDETKEDANEEDDDSSSSSSTDTETMASIDINHDNYFSAMDTQQSEDITKQLIANPVKKARTKQVPKNKKMGPADSSASSLASSNAMVMDLHNRSEALKQMSNDPLQEAVDVARSATSFTNFLTNIEENVVTTNTQKKRKKPVTITSLEFGDSDQSESELNTQVQLSDVPNKAEIARTQKPAMVPVNHANITATDYNQKKYGKKRNPFTDSEKAAIKKGVEMFGVGHWSSIKSHYAIILRDRNTTQIKDAFRTMRRKGEIDESAIPSPAKK